MHNSKIKQRQVQITISTRMLICETIFVPVDNGDGSWIPLVITAQSVGVPTFELLLNFLDGVTLEIKRDGTVHKQLTYAMFGGCLE